MSFDFVLDTSVVINLNREMPIDINPGAWAALEELASDGRIVMPRYAYNELLEIDDGCAPWAKSQDGLIVEASAEEIQIVRAITRAHPGWVKQKQNAADPWVIACAENEAAIVISQERMSGPNTADHNMKLPNVAMERAVDCMNFVALARSEGWVFH